MGGRKRADENSGGWGELCLVRFQHSLISIQRLDFNNKYHLALCETSSLHLGLKPQVSRGWKCSMYIPLQWKARVSCILQTFRVHVFCRTYHQHTVMSKSLLATRFPISETSRSPFQPRNCCVRMSYHKLYKKARTLSAMRETNSTIAALVVRKLLLVTAPKQSSANKKSSQTSFYTTIVRGIA